jgi:hypothetical protein
LAQARALVLSKFVVNSALELPSFNQ